MDRPVIWRTQRADWDERSGSAGKYSLPADVSADGAEPESWRALIDAVIPERRGGRDGWNGHPADWQRLYAMIVESFLCRQGLVRAEVYGHIRGRLRDDWALNIAETCERGYDLLEVARDQWGLRLPE